MCIIIGPTVGQKGRAMAKFSRSPRLNKTEREKLIIEFCEALVAVKNSVEAAKFLTDLLSSQEVEMLAKRLKIAGLLIKGSTYEEIREALRVSTGTIARVNTWMSVSGEGYQLVIKRAKEVHRSKSERTGSPYALRNFVENRPAHFWPELLFIDMIKKSRRKQKEELLSALNGLSLKSKLFKELTQFLKSSLESS